MTAKTGRALASGVLAAAALFDGGPLGFIPATARLPLAALSLSALWWPKAEAPRAQRWLEAAAICAVAGSWLLLRTIGLHPSRADDGIYFYLAQRFASGQVPYRDFFFAHPPVHLVVPAVAFKLLGFSVVLAKALPALLQSAAGAFLYLAVRPASRALAVLTLAFHLFSYQVLMGATDLTGTNLVTVFLAAAVWAVTARRPLAAGVFAALSLGAGAYALAGVAAIGLWLWREGRWRRGGAGFLAGLGAWVLPFALLGGSGFLDGVFRYHLAKSAPSGRASPLSGGFVSGVFQNVGAWLRADGIESLYFHPAQWLGAAVAAGLLLMAALRKQAAGPGAAQARFGLLAAGLFVAQWAALAEVYDYYTVPQMALLALPSAWGAHRAFELLRTQETVRVGAVCAAVVLLAPVLGGTAQRVAWPEEQARANQTVTYRWNDPWVPRPLAALVRGLYFVPGRERGAAQPGWRHFVWNKSLTLSTAEEMAAYLRATMTDSETISGASTLAPTLALLAGRRLAADEADTNAKRFRSGFLSERDFFEAACADGLRYLVGAPRAYFTEQQLSAHPTVRAHFERDREFVETEIRHGRPERFVLFRRRSTAPCHFVAQ